MDGINYPIKERRFNSREIQTISSFISELDTVAYKEFWGGRDEYLYILYVNNRKVLTVTEDMVEQIDFPLEYKNVLRYVISISEPLYPNFGFLITCD